MCRRFNSAPRHHKINNLQPPQSPKTIDFARDFAREGVGSKKSCDVLAAMQAKPNLSPLLVLPGHARLKADSITAAASETVPRFNLQVAARLLLLQSLTSTKSGPPS